MSVIDAQILIPRHNWKYLERLTFFCRDLRIPFRDDDTNPMTAYKLKGGVENLNCMTVVGMACISTLMALFRNFDANIERLHALERVGFIKCEVKDVSAIVQKTHNGEHVYADLRRLILPTAPSQIQELKFIASHWFGNRAYDMRHEENQEYVSKYLQLHVM